MNTIEGQRYIIEEYLANQADLKQLSGFKSFVQKIKLALRKVGFRAKWTDDEIATLMRRSLENVRKQRSPQTGNNNGARFSVDGKYFKNWQDVLTQFKKDLEGIELNQEQQDIYDVVTQQKDKIRLRINDLNELEDIFINFGSRQKGVKKFISVHYAGLRNPVTALEVLNIGDVIRRGKITEEGNADYPTSRRYELQAEDGAMLKVIIDFNRKNDKNKSVINFYSDRESDPRGQASSGGITDLTKNLSQNPENASGNQEKMRFSIAPVIESNKQWRDPDSDPRMIELEQQKAEALKDPLNALADNGQRFADIIGEEEWAEMSEEERIEEIEGSYDAHMDDLWNEIEEEQQFSREDAESLISQAYDATVQYAEQLGYTVTANDVSRKSLSTYITVDNGSEDFKIRISDHWNINRSGVEHFGNNDVDVIVQNDKIDLSDVWQFLEENAPDNGNVRFSVSDGDGFVSTADREKMITVLMGIPQQQLDNMDGAAALDYLTQKQFKVPSDDMAQSMLNTARQRRKDIIKQFADKRRKDWIMDNYPFYRALVELGGENAKVLLPKGELYKNYSGSFFARGKLKNGTAVPLKDIVDKIQASGTYTKNLESKVLKFFDGLNISKLQQSYRDSMFDPASKTVQEHENYLLNKLSENKIFSEKEAANDHLSKKRERKNAKKARHSSSFVIDLGLKAGSGL